MYLVYEDIVVFALRDMRREVRVQLLMRGDCIKRSIFLVNIDDIGIRICLLLLRQQTQAHTLSHTALPRKNDDDLFAEPLSDCLRVVLSV